MRKKSLRDERSHYGSEKEMLPTRLMQGQRRLQIQGTNLNMVLKCKQAPQDCQEEGKI